jgi:hypothetical protein
MKRMPNPDFPHSLFIFSVHFFQESRHEQCFLAKHFAGRWPGAGFGRWPGAGAE